MMDINAPRTRHELFVDGDLFENIRKSDRQTDGWIEVLEVNRTELNVSSTHNGGNVGTCGTVKFIIHDCESAKENVRVADLHFDEEISTGFIHEWFAPMKRKYKEVFAGRTPNC